MWNILTKAGIRTPLKLASMRAIKKMRKEVSTNHGFRKFYHTIISNGRVLPEIRECYQDRIGLSGSYYKPTENEMLQEYLKVVDDLTINDETDYQERTMN